MIAKLQAMLGMDASKFNAGTKKAGNNVDKFGKGLGKIKGLIAGAFSIGIIVAFGRKMLKLADDMQTTANTFNISMNTVLALKSVMAASGIQTEKFLKILGNIKKSQGEVIRGTSTYVDAVEALNMSQEEFVGLPVDKLLEVMAKRYVDAGESAEAFNGITTLFGSRIGVTLIEVFKRLNGANGLEGYKKKTEAAAAGMKTLAAASDSLEETQNNLIMSSGTLFGKYLQFFKEVGTTLSFKGDLKELWQIQDKEKQIEKIKELTEQLKSAAEARRALAKAQTTTTVEEKEANDKWTKASTKAWYEALDTQKKIVALEEQIASIKEDKETATMKEWYGLDIERMETEKKISALKDKQSKEADKTESKKAALADKMEKQDIDYEKRAAAIRAGKGIGAPDMARVSRLQAIGGVVGRASGVGDQAARIAKRQMAMQEARKQLDINRNKEIVALRKEFHDSTEGE